jgi:dynein heavy chain
VNRFNRLISEVSTSIVMLKKAIKGEVVMTNELDSMYQSLLNNQVP